MRNAPAGPGREEVSMRKWMTEAGEFVAWFWEELHRTDLGDDTHYPNGFRKWNNFPLSSRTKRFMRIPTMPQI